MLEIMLIGHGGQGSVVAAKLLGDAAVKAGYNSQSFSSYGAERRGGRVESYIRLDQATILVHSKMYEPDYLVMMDDTLVKDPKKMPRLKKGAKILINTSEPKNMFSALKNCDVTTIDANQIATDKGLTLPSGMIIINTIMLGAIGGLLPYVKEEHLVQAIKEGKIPAAEKNIEATLEAYCWVKEHRQGSVTSQVTKAANIISERLPAYQVKTPPCLANCPAGENIERTAYFIENGRFKEALAAIKTENPFPGICGRVCFHPCETHCNRNQYDEGVAANALERAAFDYAEASLTNRLVTKTQTGKKVAIIGSGPAGMTCAHYLALLGHEVTLFEALPVPGGVPRFGIPKYRLPKDIVEREIKEIAELGVKIRVNTRVGQDISFETLAQDHDACFIATGAQHSARIDIPGENSDGVIAGLEFLKDVTLGGRVDLGKKVAVIGGGNTAVDAARTAKRMGASEVTIVYRRSAEEMPAYKSEVIAAQQEGIRIIYLTMPLQIFSQANHVNKLECLKTKLGDPDKNGRRRPVPEVGSNFIIDVDTIVAAIGETIEPPFLTQHIEMLGPVIKVDHLGRTSLVGIYAGGDATSQSRSVVEAIASGKRAALGIDLFLTGGDEKEVASFLNKESGSTSMSRYLAGDHTRRSNGIVSFDELNIAYFTKKRRLAITELPLNPDVASFDETCLGLSRSDSIAEAERCFHCGHCTMCENCYIFCPDLAVSYDANNQTPIINKDVCKVCGICIQECPRKALVWEGA